MSKLFITLFVLAVGCTPPDDAYDCWHGKASQCKAEQIVWGEQYGMMGHDPPDIEWVSGVQCPYNENFKHAIIFNWHCIDGVFYSVPYYAVIVWHDSFSNTSYAHEMLHAALQHRYGDDDSNHSRIEWKQVDIVNQQLALTGL